MRPCSIWLLRGVIILTFLFIASCNGMGSGSEVYVWIDVPINGLTLPTLQSIQIEGHASAFTGIKQVDIQINDTLLTTISDFETEGEFVAFQTSWTPTLPGKYEIRVWAYNAAGVASKPDVVLISIGEKISTIEEFPTVITTTPTVTPEITPTLTVTPTNTVTPTATITIPPSVFIEFWANPANINAGSCTNLQWNVKNALSVSFGGTNQPFSGSDEECPCESKTYTLTVIQLDGTKITRDATVSVSGVCDSEPPPAPQLAVPLNGLSIECKASQTLTWLPVSDPSGISYYKVEVQRSSGGSAWSNVSGSPFTVTDKSIPLPVECGYDYRWRVQAVDGKGLIGEWSDWFTFSILLG